MEDDHTAGGLVGLSTLVTGGGSGIGLGCAVRFASDGAHVTICGRSEDRLATAAEVIRKTARPGTNVQWLGCDVTDEGQVRAAVDFARSVTGTIDGVVASAGGNSSLGRTALGRSSEYRPSQRRIRTGGSVHTELPSRASTTSVSWQRMN